MTDDRYKYHGQIFFIDICNDYYKYYTELNEQETTNHTTNIMEISNQKVNEWVAGYAELKK